MAEASKRGWHCEECGKKFHSQQAAERAAFGDNGCPNFVVVKKLAALLKLQLCPHCRCIVGKPKNHQEDCDCDEARDLIAEVERAAV